MAEDRHAKAAEQARQDIERLQGQGDIGGSAMLRAAKRAQAHFSASDIGSDDPAEIWGRRIGRGVAVVAMVLLIWWIVTTYMLR